MNNAFYAQELSDDQLEMVVGGHHKSGNGGHVTVLANVIKQSTTDVIVQSATAPGAGAAAINNAGENGQNINNSSQSIF